MLSAREHLIKDLSLYKKFKLVTYCLESKCFKVCDRKSKTILIDGNKNPIFFNFELKRIDAVKDTEKMFIELPFIYVKFDNYLVAKEPFKIKEI